MNTTTNQFYDQYQTIYSSCFDRLFSFLSLKCHNAEDARDLTQETFLKLWQNREKITVGKELNYLFTIATNLFIDKKRREKVNQTYLANHNSDYERENPEFCYLTKEYSHKVEACLLSMPISVREVFIKNKIEKKTYAEIATEYGLTVKAIEKRMGHALRIFRTVQTTRCA